MSDKTNEIPEADKIPDDAKILKEEFLLQKKTNFVDTDDSLEYFHIKDIKGTTATSVTMFDKIFKDVKNEDPDSPVEGTMSFTIYDVSFDFSFSKSETRAVWLFQIKNFVEIIFLNLFQFVSYSKSTDNKFKLIVKQDEGSILIEHPYIIDNNDEHNYLETVKLVSSQFINVKKQYIDWRSKGMTLNSTNKVDTNFFFYFL